MEETAVPEETKLRKNLEVNAGGKIKLFAPVWRKLTSDPFINTCVSGCVIDFVSPPCQLKPAHVINFKKEEKEALDAMVTQYEEEGVIMKCPHEEGEFVNNVFLREKRDSGGNGLKYRMILNVKRLNTFVRYVHFKMDTLHTCLQLIERGCYMASLDLSNAYHSVSMHSDYTKFLKFVHNQYLYKYLVLPQGFRDSPRIFTKIMKPVLAHLPAKGIVCSLYIDDFYIQGSSYEECEKNVRYTSYVIESLGFAISDKSILTPSQIIYHLGFVLNSVDMTVSLSHKKKEDIINLISNIQPFITVRFLARIIGILVASFPAVQYGLLFYRNLECQKIKALNTVYNFDRIIQVSELSFKELDWWRVEGVYSTKRLHQDNPSYIMRTDASGIGYGAVMNDIATQGLWSEEERRDHINVLEIRAVLLGLQSLCKSLSQCHIRAEVDNMTAVSYINNMGGTHSALCNEITRELILWCKSRNIWISACHIPGVDNTTADSYSRKLSVHTEWMLNKTEFKKLCDKFGTPDIDLFAARTNFLLPMYMSLYPDPSACAINAFYHSWNGFVYLFPPFNMISRVLQKLIQDRTPRALMIVPLWDTQPWFPKLMRMVIEPPLPLKRSKTLLILPSDKSAVHPMYPKLQIIACLLSGIR